MIASLLCLNNSILPQVHRSLRGVYNYAVPYDEFDCFHKAFIVSNGVPVQFTRDLFYRFNYGDGQRLLFDYMAKFSLNKTSYGAGQHHGPLALPFALS